MAVNTGYIASESKFLGPIMNLNLTKIIFRKSDEVLQLIFIRSSKVDALAC